MVTKFPRLFLVFPPSMGANPLCIQVLAHSTPQAPSQIIASLSWCGNFRSTPPPWMSSGAPRYLYAIALHSTCQPGRPSPQGLGHEGSSPFDRFHRAKSSGSSFGLVTAADSTTISSNFWWDKIPNECFAFLVRKYTSPSTGYA